MTYPSFIKRVIAAIFDLAIINVLVMLLGDVALKVMGSDIDEEKMQQMLESAEAGASIDMGFMQNVIVAAIVLSLLSVVVVIIMDAILPATRWQASPGKKLLGMVIVDEEGERISMGKSFARHAAKFVSAISLVGFLMPIWNPRRQALHDKLARTFVVNAKSVKVAA